jgi:predicted RNase H-like HicB family nuclease/predicted RNA binding protein YcfA (HicA-like mRNA interferase family)
MPTPADVPSPVRPTRPEEVCDRLSRRGFAVLDRSPSHALLGNDRRKVIVPTHPLHLPLWIERVIEWSLETELGPRWVIGPEPAVAKIARPTQPSVAARARPVVVAHHVIERTDEGWHGFVVEQFEIISCGASFDETRAHLVEAAELWFAYEGLAVTLVPAGGGE